MKSFFFNYHFRRQVMAKIRNSVKVLKGLAIASSNNNDYNTVRCTECLAIGMAKTKHAFMRVDFC